jgi:hypothetical protein
MTKYRSQNREAAAARKRRMKKRPERQKRNPFACEGWGRFIMRSVRADEAARAAARARVTATGETLH